MLRTDISVQISQKFEVVPVAENLWVVRVRKSSGWAGWESYLTVDGDWRLLFSNAALFAAERAAQSALVAALLAS